jgi:drug/metabolite transporter (DMT)-like permease
MAAQKQGRITNPYRKILGLLAISTVAYSVAAVLSFSAVINLPLQDAVFMIAAGFSMGYLLLSRLFRLNATPQQMNAFNVSGGAITAVSVLIVYMAFTRFTLASVYPIVAAAVVVFFAVDYIRFRKRISGLEAGALGLGVLLVFLGTFFTESRGFTFNMDTLPYVIGIVITGGIGFYLMLYNIERKNAGARSASMPMTMAVLALGGMAAFGLGAPMALFLAIGMIGGFFLSIAIISELVAMEREESRSMKKNLISRNFVNNFTYLDVVIVLAMSVLLRSYTVQEVIGGLVVVAGVIIIGFVR